MRILLSMLILMSYISLQAQHRLAIYDVQRPTGSSSLLNDVSSHIVGFYASDDRFIVIDKANSQLIENEQDRQKSEEFIDGYIVQQGMQEGFDYCYYPKYDKKEKTLSVKVYDVAKGTVVTNQEVTLKNTILGTPKDMKSAINKVIEKVNTDCFELRYEIVRCIDKKMKSEAKDLLFALGYNQRAKEQDDYEIYQLVTETIGGKELSRKEVIAKGRILEVQDGNFSTLRVIKGGDVVMTALKAATPLYASLINK